MGEPFLLVLVKMAENMRPTNEDAFLCRRPVSAELQPTRGGPGTRWKADGAAGHRGRTGRRAVLPPRLGWHVCRIVGTGSAAETGRVTSRESPKGTDGRAGAEAAWASSGGGALRGRGAPSRERWAAVRLR